MNDTGKEDRRIIVIDARGAVHGHSTDLPDMQPGDSVRVTMTDDGGFDVVPLVACFGRMSNERAWADAPEQENDRPVAAPGLVSVCGSGIAVEARELWFRP